MSVEIATPPLKVAMMSFAHVHAWSYLSYLTTLDSVEILTSDPDGASAPDDGPRGKDFAALFNVGYVSTWAELFEWHPDVVIICTENSRHLEAVRLAASAGAHVLCEKPLATTVADAEEILRVVDEAGVMIMTAFPVRFIPGFRELSELVRAGAVGDVLGVIGTNNGKIPVGTRRWFTDPELAGGGALVDHVVHCADLLDSLLGERVVSVRAVGNRILHQDLDVAVETGGLVTLIYESGIVATIDCSWSQPLNSGVWGGVSLQVAGTLGTLGFEAFSSVISGDDATGEVWLPFGFDMDKAMIAHFLDEVRNGRQPQPDGRVGLRTTQIVEAARTSALTGQPVTIDDLS
jgi:1,5-anhydro-D-fructose reductase (1,5-anhydro-D-mannitol-forming)